MATGDQELRLRERLSKLGGLKLIGGTKVTAEMERLQRQLERLRTDTSDEEIWRSVELARHPDRPYTLDYVERMLDDVFELRGDRGRLDDHAIVSLVGKLGKRILYLLRQGLCRISRSIEGRLRVTEPARFLGPRDNRRNGFSQRDQCRRVEGRRFFSWALSASLLIWQCRGVHVRPVSAGRLSKSSRSRTSLAGHFLTSTRSEADAGNDRIQVGADPARRRTHRTEVPEVDFQ